MKLQIERSIKINKPAAHVYGIISDFKEWNFWSPWNHCEPTSKTTVTGEAGAIGQMLSWEGEVIGSGQMTSQNFVSDNIVQINLEFLKPWKSKAKVIFNLTAGKPDETTVSWSMDSELPIFMFFFKNMLAAYMRSDFDRGLLMLKEYSEKGTVSSKSVYKGEKNVEAFQVVGRKSTCAISDLSSVMQNDYRVINEMAAKGQLQPPSKVTAVYHKFDIPKGVCEFTAGFSYPAHQEVKAPATFPVLKFAPHKSIIIDHMGPYRYLNNPWAMANSYLRGKKMKPSKEVPMYEHYITMPDGRPEKDIITQIHMPVRS
jgi:hypothetical protein